MGQHLVGRHSQPALVTSHSQPQRLQGDGRVQPNGDAVSPKRGRWNKKRLSPKDPAEAATEVTKAIDALIDHLEMTTEIKRQEEAFKNAARTIHNLLRINDDSFNAMILAGAGGTGKTRLVKETLFECALQQEEQHRMRVAWLEHHKVSPVQLLNDLYAYRDKDNVIVFDDMDRMFDDFEIVEILNGALENEGTRLVHAVPTEKFGNIQPNPFPYERQDHFHHQRQPATND